MSSPTARPYRSLFPTLVRDGAVLRFVDPATGAALPAYSDASLANALSGPIAADPLGTFPQVWLHPDRHYRAELLTARGKAIAAHLIQHGDPPMAGPDDAGLFLGLNELPIPASVARLRTEGWSHAGSGIGDYISDSLATPELAERHPRFCTVTGSGTCFRLADSDGMITVEQGGAVGDPDGSNRTDDREAFQATIDYANEVGIERIGLGHARYSLWCPERRTLEAGSLHAPDGNTLVIAPGQRVHFIGLGSARAHLAFRAPGGLSYEGDTPGRAFHLVGGKVWRGSGFFVRGQGRIAYAGKAATTNQALTLEHLVVDGGTRKSDYFGIPARPSDGRGWDVTHKGVYGEADRSGGDITILDCEMTGWRGETVYTSNDPSTTLKVRNSRFSDSNGQGLNPNGCMTDIEDCRIENSYMGIEGWTGRGGGHIVRTEIVDCHGVLGQNGGAFALDGGYYDNRKAHVSANAAAAMAGQPVPGTIDITCRRCGLAYLGSSLAGNLTLEGTKLMLGNRYAYAGGSRHLRLAITLVNSTAGIAQVSIAGANGPKGARLTDDIDLKIDGPSSTGPSSTGRDDPAVIWMGSLGPGVRVRMRGLGGRKAPHAVAAITDYAPRVEGW